MKKLPRSTWVYQSRVPYRDWAIAQAMQFSHLQKHRAALQQSRMREAARTLGYPISALILASTGGWLAAGCWAVVTFFG